MAITQVVVIDELLQATMEQERRYQGDLTQLNNEVILVLTVDLSKERKEVSELRTEVGELKRVVAIAKEDRHLAE